METSSQSAKKEGRQHIINHKTKQCCLNSLKKYALHYSLTIFSILHKNILKDSISEFHMVHLIPKKLTEKFRKKAAKVDKDGLVLISSKAESLLVIY